MTSSLSIARRPGELDPGQPERRLAVDPLASPESFKRQAYTALKNAIAAMDVYGSRTEIRLDERRLAQEFGISRTPVRERSLPANQKFANTPKSVTGWSAREQPRADAPGVWSSPCG